MSHTLTLRSRNSGNVLFVSLILLLVITVIGISSISGSGLNEKMASNYSDHNLAFQAAEAALLAGEKRARDISGILKGAGLNGTPPYFSCTSTNCFTSTCLNGLCFNGTYPPTGGGSGAGICTKTNPTTELWLTTATWTTAGRYAEHPVAITGLAAQPKYIVEFMCYVRADPNTPATTSAPNYGTDWAFMYRITALGVGQTTASKAMIQSTYKVLR